MKRLTIIFAIIFIFLIGCNKNDLNNDKNGPIQNWKLNTEIEINFNDEVLFSSVESLNQYYESYDNLNDLNKLKKYYNNEFFKTKDLLLIGFNTCSSEIAAGEININQIKVDENGYSLFYDMSSPEENTDDTITLSYIIEMKKADNNDEKKVNIFIINKLSNERGSVYYPLESQKELPRKYFISFDANGGILQNSSIFVYEDKDYILPIPTKEDYLFAGWYDELNNEVTSGTWNRSSDISLIAKWEKAEDFVFSYIILGNGNENKSGYYIIKYLGNSTELNIPLYNNTTPIIYIGADAFKDNNSLEKVNITSNIIQIDGYGFNNCPKLKELIIGKSLMKVDSYSFFKISLDKIRISEENNYYYGVDALIEKSTETLIIGTNNSKIDIYNIRTIGENSFSDLDGLTEIKLPSSVDLIGSFAFFNCINLTSIILSNNITNINDSAFRNCESLVNITLPESLITLGDNVFYGCTSLKEITIPSGVKNIGFYNFKDCISLEKVTFSEGVSSTGTYTFHNCVSLKSLNFPSTINGIGTNIIEGCNNIESLTVDENNPNMYSKNNCIISGKTLLLGCNTSVIPLDEGIVAIREYAFYKCNKLTEVVIPDTVILINRGVFTGCINLTSVTLGSNLEYIGDNAFSNCESLIEIDFPQKLKNIGWMAFSGCISLSEIYLPSSIESIHRNVFTRCVNISKVEVDPNNDVYYSEANCVIEKDTKTLVYGCKNSIIPEGVVKINAESFSGCSGLASLYIPSSVVIINPEAFWNCNNINTITVHENNPVFYSINNCLIDRINKTLVISATSIIPDDGSVTKIGQYAFYYWRELQTITIPETITDIGRGAFSGCFNLETVNLPSNLIKIDELAFMYCNKLKNITLPDTLTYIGNYAFSGCEEIESIFIPISVEYMGQNAFSGMKNTTLYCEAPASPEGWYNNFYTTGVNVFWGSKR